MAGVIAKKMYKISKKNVITRQIFKKLEAKKCGLRLRKMNEEKDLAVVVIFGFESMTTIPSSRS